MGDTGQYLVVLGHYWVGYWSGLVWAIYLFQSYKWTGLDGLDWILLRTLVHLEHPAVLIIMIMMTRVT